jgi:spore germination protein GerM
MKRLIVLAVAAAMMATACAERGAHVVGNAPTGPNPTLSPTEVEVTATASGPVGVPSVTFQVWFTRSDHLFPVPWVVPETKAVGRASLEALLGGPPDPSVAEGVGTQVPPGTTLLGLSISNGLATVNLSPEFLSGGSAVSEWTRLGQVVLTIGQFPTVKSVAIQLDAQPVKPFDIQGAALGRPWQRSDFEQLLPAIVVEQPTIGVAVSSPVEVSGTADVFEATVSLRILDAGGNEIASGVTNATCGTGCRGTFRTTLAFHVDQDQPGTVEVFEASAENGQPVNIVDIPVTLQA